MGFCIFIWYWTVKITQMILLSDLPGIRKPQRPKGLKASTPVYTPSPKGTVVSRSFHLEEEGILVLPEVLLACVLPGNPEHGLSWLIIPAHPWELPTLHLFHYPISELSSAANPAWCHPGRQEKKQASRQVLGEGISKPRPLGLVSDNSRIFWLCVYHLLWGRDTIPVITPAYCFFFCSYFKSNSVNILS